MISVRQERVKLGNMEPRLVAPVVQLELMQTLALIQWQIARIAQLAHIVRLQELLLL